MKKTITICLLLALLLTCASAAFADANVTYDGNAKKFIFAPGSKYSPTDLFPDFKNVMPGDSLTQRLTVKNDRSYETKVKIYLRVLGAQEGSKAFLSQLHMTVTASQNNTMAYMFDAAADQTDGLTDWVLLGTLYSGGQVNLDVKLVVPIELDDSFQDAVAYLDWQFKVEELPVDPDDPQPPQTGDTSMIVVVMGIAVVSGGALVLLTVKGRKKRKQA